MNLPDHRYLHYGCGWCAPDGWLNFDASPTLRIERLPIIGKLCQRNARRFPANVRYGNIVRGLPVATASCEAIYCSHVLEHLALEEFEKAVENTFVYLRPGGTFRLVVPDLEQLARNYLSNSETLAAARFMEHAHLGARRRARGLSGFLVEWLGNSSHRWMWDEKALRYKLNEHGFSRTRRAAFNDSENKRFMEVEEKARFDECLAIEAIK
jgi:predicted SAM-dependent methyltransferase